MLPLQQSHDFSGRISFVSHRKQDLKRRIVLLKERPQIRFEIKVQAGQRFQYADRLSGNQDGRPHGQITQCCYNLQQRINNRTTEDEKQNSRENFAWARFKKQEYSTPCAWKYGASQDQGNNYT